MNIYPAEYEDVYQTCPITIVDGGASGGIMPLWKLHRRHLFVIGFEPDARAFDALNRQQNRLVKYFNFGLHQQRNEIPFYLTRKQENSSCYRPNRELLDRFPKPNRFDVIEETSLKCRSLDDFLHEENLSDVDFVKLDTQGSELNILRGAATILEQSVFGLEIEVCFSELYQDAPLFSNIDLFVRQFGFDLIDLRTVSWKRTVGANVGNSKGQLVFADALYFKQPQHIQKTIKSLEDKRAKSKLLRSLSICLIYGFLDYAIELLDIMGPEYFSDRELNNLNSHIKSQVPLACRVPNFPLRRQLAVFFSKLSKWLTPRKHKKADPYLGNF